MNAASASTGTHGLPRPGINPPRLGRTGPNAVARHLAGRVRAATAGRDDVIVWRTRDNRLRLADIGPRCWDLGMECSYPIRVEFRWSQRRAYSNERWFSLTGESLHCESMTERLGLMQLEYFFNTPGLPSVEAAATQPMLIISRGRHRYPDAMLRLSDGRRLVIDIKRRSAMSEVVAKNLEVTRQVCREVGWDYAVLHEPARTVEFNLEILSSRRHPRFAPWPELRDALLAQCLTARPLRDVVDAVSPLSRGYVMPYVHHLMWTRAIDPETLFEPLDWGTRIAATAVPLER